MFGNSPRRALGHRHRLELLEQVAQGERNVETLAARVGLSIANASQHLQQLRRAGLVTSRRQGKFVLYRLADETALVLLSTLRQVAERNVAEVDRIVRNYFDDLDSMEPVSRETLRERLRDGTVTVVAKSAIHTIRPVQQKVEQFTEAPRRIGQ